jgi:NAD(P)-dependent dehydrogenase (short-subunit alcohol dehydrogenase family)
MQKIALVTGASRGIGAASARRLAAAGFAVCVNYKAQQGLAEALVAELRTFGVRAIAVQADVAVEVDVVRMFEQVDKQLGPLWVLVNNAAMLSQQMRVEQMTAARINNMLMTNVTSAFICCREAVLRMSKERGGAGGSIVNVSSAAARLGSAGEYVDYAASKGALDTLTTGLALEVAAEGIRVNSVRPGFIYTDMHADGGEPGRVDRMASMIPMRRGGTADEVAAAIVWLASEESSYATGTFIDLAGGR